MIPDLYTIIGAGPVGLLLGCLLRQKGIHCQILEKNAKRSELNRALMIHSASLDILSELSLDKIIIEQGIRQRYIHFDVEGQRRYSLDFSKLSTAFPYFINLRQPLLEQSLEACFIALGGRLFREHRLLNLSNMPGQVRLEVATPNGLGTIKAPFVIGCDGANSTVRQLLNLSFSGHDYPFSYLLAEGLPNQQHGLAKDASYMAINATAALSIIPLENGEYRMAGPGKQLQANDMPTDAEEMSAHLCATGLKGLPAIKHYSAIRHYKVRERLAHRFAVGRILLCGDAAHVHSPAGGQAMNLGFADVFSLAWRLAAGVDPSAIEASWAQERQCIARQVIVETQILPLLTKMRNGTVQSEELDALTEIYSQLFHDVGSGCSALRQQQLNVGVRIPNLPLTPGRTIWSALAGKHRLDLSSQEGVARALSRYFKRSGVIEWRPDFHVCYLADKGLA